MMPLSTSGPPQRRLIHSTSLQSSVGSNWVLVQEARLEVSPTPSTWPTMLPNCRRGVPSMFRHHRGLVSRLSRLATVGLGGVDSPFFTSLWRWPRMVRSSVSTSAEQRAARARSIRRSMNARSRST